MVENKKSSIFLNGIIKENPTFVMLLGMCPTLAITTTLGNAIGMGLAVMFVLFFSNLFISLIRKIVPNEIRIPVFIVIVATLVTVVSMLLQAFLPDLNNALGAFVALIVVNCIILGRAEAFASKNSVGSSLLDALGMALGFTLAISLISVIRELIGNGSITVWGPMINQASYAGEFFVKTATGFGFNFIKVFDFLHIVPFTLMIDKVGAFLTLGILIGIKVAISEKKHHKEKVKVA